MITRNKKRKGFYLILIIFLAVFLPLSIYYLHTPVELTNYKSLLLPKVEKAVHLNIELEELGLTILPYPRLSFRGLAIREGEYIILKAESVKASLALIPLLFHKEFEVKNLVITGSDVFIKREAGGGLNIVRILKETSIPISIKKVRMKTGKAHFIDEFLKGKVKYEATDIDATLTPKGIKDFSYSGSMKLLPVVKVKFSGQTKDAMQDFEGAAHIQELNIGQTWPYLASVFPGEKPDTIVDASLNYKISIKNGFTISMPKAEFRSADFTISTNLEFMSSKDDDDKLVLNLSATSIPLSSIKGQFFISVLPDALKQEIELISFNSGEIKISDLKLAGNIKELRRASYYKSNGSLQAVVEVKNAGFMRKGSNQGFSMVNGIVKWRDGNLTMQEINGRYGRSVVERAGGSIEQVIDAPFIRLKGRLVLDAEETVGGLNSWLSGKMLLQEGIKGITADGLIPLSFDIAGALEISNKSKGKGLMLSVSIDTASANIGYASWFKKEKGYNMIVDAGLLIRRDSVTIDKAKINFGESTFDIKGFLSQRQGLSYQLDITASDARLHDIDEIIPRLKKEFASGGSLSANLNINKDKQRPMKLKGVIYLKDGEFETKLLPKRISDANLSIKFYGSSGAVAIDAVRIGNSTFSGVVNIPDITAASINFNLASPFVDAEDIYQYDGSMRRADMPFTGKGRLSAKAAKVKGFHIKSFETDVMLKSDAVLLKTIFISNNGKVIGNFIYSKDEEDGFSWRMNLEASKVELEPLIKEIGADEKVLSGDADGKIELVARRGEGEVAKRIDGKADIHSKNGRLWKFIVLSKIFSIVNIISIDELFKDGLPYKTVAGNFVIEDGVISTENLLLDSNSMRMSAIGIIDVPSMTIDAKLGLHPFVTVDKIITNIPLAGWIIGGKEKSTISMYYKIKGPLRDPDVELIPVQALGEGVLGIFKRVLRLPLDAIEPLVK